MLENFSKMKKFKNLKSIPAHMPILNIDTDMIIPKQFLKTIKRTGLGKNLFYEMRYDEKGNEIEDFILNKKPFTESKILLAGKNFGCGSSREHAPWALIDFGIKCVISPSFADIFYSNCFKNGILPIILSEKIIQELAEYSKREAEIEIKIETQEIIYGNKVAKFDLDQFKKKCLIEGIDDIDLSLEKISNIQDYENKINDIKPWLTNND
jgi:3-isopropylmalate/(R)-2-methylmalate dehydratase small subunit